MPTFQPGLILFKKPLCLASTLTTTLVELSDKERLATQVVLPTSRLANRICAQACQQLGAWYEPRFFTFESWVEFHFNLISASETLPRSVDDIDIALTLGYLIRAGNYRHINQSHISELKQLFNEFEDWRLGVDGFSRLRDVLAENTFRSDEAIANLFERVDETEHLYNRFEETLGAENKMLARRRQVLKADLLTDAIEHGQRPACNRILMAGITSIMPWSHGLLTAIAKHWPLQVWAPAPEESSATATPDRDPVRVLMAALAFPADRVTSLSESECLDEPTQISIFQATGVLEETAAALNQVNKALSDGIRPAEIGVLVTNDHEYGRPLRALLHQLPSISFNAAITKPFSTSQTGSWLASLRQLLNRGEDAAALTSFLTHPVTLFKIHQGLPKKHQKRKSVLREELIRELCQAGVESGLSATTIGIKTKNPGLADGITAAQNALSQFLAPDYVAPLIKWYQHFSDLLLHFAPTAHEDPTRPGLKNSVQTGLDTFLSSIGQSVIKNEPIDASVFCDMVGEHLLASDIRDTGDQLQGVQILSVEEARFVPFRLLIVLGCNEGSFPRALPKDYLFDNFLKTKIGLPGWQAVEAIEDSTFQLLKARTPNLLLFYSENPADGLKIRSRFIDEIKQSGSPSLISIDGPAALRPYIKANFSISACLDRELRVAEAGKFTGDRPALLERLSATSLESLIKCPYRFLLRQLGVRELEIPEEDDRRKEGDWLHGVLEAFFTGNWGEKKIDEPIDTGITPADFRAYAMNRLITLTDAICPSHLSGTETWVQARTIGWPAFARHISGLYAQDGLKRIGYGKREQKYKTSIPLTPNTGAGFSPVLSGKIDSIDLPVEGIQIITDYKRSSVPKKQDVLNGNSPQLTLYAAALSELTKNKHHHSSSEDAEAATYPETTLDTALIGYWSILKGEFTGVAAGADIRDLADQLGLMPLKTKGDLKEVFSNLQRVVGQRKQELLESPAIKPDPKDCTFCGYSGICRKDDPEFSSHVTAAPEPVQDEETL